MALVALPAVQKGIMMDDDEDIICLSSDTDEESHSTTVPTGLAKQKLSSISLPGTGAPVTTAAMNGHFSKKVPCTSNGGNQSPTEVILDGDTYEIEYSRNDYETPSEVRRISDSDKEIEILNEDSTRNVRGQESEQIARSKPCIENKKRIQIYPVPASSSGCSSSSKGDLTDEFADETETKKAITLFLNAVCKKCPKAHYQKIQSKIWKHYDKVKDFATPIQHRLQDEIRNATKNIVEFPDTLFTTVKTLLDLMEPGTVVSLKEIRPEDRESQRNEQKRKLIEKYERELQKIQRKIKAYEEAEVDFCDSENEHNSSYILWEKYKKKLMSSYYRICNILKCNHFTDRPTQKKIILRKHGVTSKYPEIDAEIERFLNKKGYQFIPDFTDIETLFRKTNHSKNLGLNSSDISEKAKFIFAAVVKIIKRRRAKDFQEGMVDAADVVSDPADEDQELRKKLEENDKLRKSERDVIDHFVKLAQEQEGEPELVAEEDVNNSPVASENEEEDDNEDDEDESEAVLEAPLNAELTEDEDDDSVLDNGYEYYNSVDPSGNSNTSNLVSQSSTQVETEEPDPMTQRLKEQSNEAITPSPSLNYVEKHKNCSEGDITEPPTKRLRSDSDVGK